MINIDINPKYMLKRIIKFILKFIMWMFFLIILIAVICIVIYKINPDKFTDYSRILPIFPDKLIDTIRFFPNYNPFAKQYEDTLPSADLLAESNNNSGSQNINYIVHLRSSSLVVRTFLNLSPIGNIPREVLIYLPKGYDPAINTKRYPVLYLLHGSPGHASDWIRSGHAIEKLDEKIANKEIVPFIAVFPDGNGGNNHDSEYINSAQGDSPVEDFISKTLVNYIDSNFLTIPQPQNRAIGGLSEGAFGSLNLGLKHQDIFGYILSISGYGRISQTPLTSALINGSQQIIHDNSPDEYIPELQVKNVKTLLVVDDQPNHQDENNNIDNLLHNSGLYVDILPFHGAHDWPFWRNHLPDAIKWLGQFWKTQ